MCSVGAADALSSSACSHCVEKLSSLLRLSAFNLLQLIYRTPWEIGVRLNNVAQTLRAGRQTRADTLAPALSSSISRDINYCSDIGSGSQSESVWISSKKTERKKKIKAQLAFAPNERILDLDSVSVQTLIAPFSQVSSLSLNSLSEQTERVVYLPRIQTQPRIRSQETISILCGRHGGFA